MQPMRSAALAVSVLAAIASTPASAAHGPVVRASGQIGPFHIDRTTEAQLRSIAGPPARVENNFSPGRRRPIGHELDLTRERVRQLEGQALARLGALRDLITVAA